MSLIPQHIINKIPNLYETENEEEKICYVKLFLPSSNWTWYIIEIDKSDNNTCYALVDGFEQELGYFTIRELENLKGLFGLKVELDTSFNTTKLSKIKGAKMLAFDYYIIKESKNKFKDWTKAGLGNLQKQYKKLQDKKERKRVKKILDDFNKLGDKNEYRL